MPLDFTAKHLSLSKREMACVLKIAVVVLAIIAAEETCDASDEDRQVQTENPWKEFWTRNSYVLRDRTTDGTVVKCEWYHRVSSNDTGATIQGLTYIPNTERLVTRGTKFWRLVNSSSMSWVDSEGGGCDYYLQYHDENYTCGVVQYQCYTNVEEELRNDYEDQCNNTQEQGAERCKGGRCKNNLEEPGKWICKDNTHFELLVTEDVITTVPEECTKCYEKKKYARRENKNEAHVVEKCKFNHTSS